MNPRSQTFSALVNYTGSAFSVIGAVLTIYFGVFYVPSYIRSAEQERIATANNELVTTLQEITFNKQEISPEQLHNQIRGIELRFNILYPYPPYELVTQVQESFMSMRFLPFNQRSELATKLDSLRTILKSEPHQTTAEKSELFGLLSIFSMLISILIGLAGLFSSFFRFKKEREITIEAEVKTQVAEIETEIHTGLKYEKLIGEVLQELKIPYEVFSQRRAIAADFIVKVNNKIYLLEAKYYVNKRIDAGTVAHLLSLSFEEAAPIVLVTNSELSDEAKRFVKDYNQLHTERGIFVIKGSNRLELTTEFKKLFAKGT
ncbi:MAG: hypothetical protein EPO24_01960 [Bacteroidetes bacterium]|nr:MAG: hypothetical protein EPO24_01960 [Bacteroidota bacterium]